MKQPILLKNILDICFLFLVLTFLSFLATFVITFIFGESFYPFEINGNALEEISTLNIILIAVELCIGGLSIYTIYILRKLIRDFLKGKLFTRFQIVTLNLIGQLIVTITITKGIMNFLGTLLIESRLRIGLRIELSFASLWFILAIGLFFIYLSKIFERAKKLKEENELTV